MYGPFRTAASVAILGLVLLFFTNMYFVQQVLIISQQTASMESRIQVLQASLNGTNSNPNEKLDVGLKNARYGRTYEDSHAQVYSKDVNNTAHAGKTVLFYNRVAKAGSMSLMAFLKLLARNNIFHIYMHGPKRYSDLIRTTAEEMTFTERLTSFEEPSSYSEHTAWQNFTSHAFPVPIYINMVRDPIERVISWYHYIRAPWYMTERKQKFPDIDVPNASWYKKTFNNCVVNGDSECQFIPGEFNGNVGYRSQILFFCGNDDFCKEFEGKQAFRVAKQNVEREYAVVGVLEEMDKTLDVLEAYIPAFFRNASAVYKENEIAIKEVIQNIYKPQIPDIVKELIRKNFTLEFEFYEFCRQRLQVQYSAIQKHV